jgi:hypothetical protein
MVLLKRLGNADAGTATKVGGNDWDELYDYFNGVALGKSASIQVPTTYRNTFLKLRNAANTFSSTFTNPPVLADQDLEFSAATTWYIYKSGTNFKAKSGYLGTVVYTNTSLDTLWSNLMAGLDADNYGQTAVGATIEFARGSFPFTGAEATISQATTGSHNIQVRGQGYGTKISFTNGSAQLSGFHISSTQKTVIQNLRIQCSDNITNFIRVNGSSRCILRDLWLDKDSAVRTASQVGILIDNISTTYYTFIDRVHFQYLDLAIRAAGVPNANGTWVVNCDMINTDKGIEINSAENIINNIKFQASGSYGAYVVKLVGANAQINLVDNIWTDAMTAGDAIILTSGANRNHIGSNISNSGGKTRTISNLSGDRTNVILCSNGWISVPDTNTEIDTLATLLNTTANPLATNAKKVGVWYGGPAAGGAFFGLLGNIGVTGTPGTTATTADGAGTSYATGTTPGNNAGWLQSRSMVTRALNPYFAFRFKLSAADATPTQRVYIGWQVSVTAPGGDDPLNATQGFLFGQATTTNNNWVIMRNDGVSGTVIASTGTAFNTSVHTIELVGDATNSRFGYSLDGGAFTYYTTDIPLADQALTYVAHIETSDTVDKTITGYAWFVRQDK